MRYRVSNTLDPEERLEDAAMAKAMHDALGVEIISEGDADFGRDRMFSGPRKNIAYWRDPAFLGNAARDIEVCGIERAAAAVKEYHEGGRGAFVKSTDLKLFTRAVPSGVELMDALGDGIAYSVIDRPACLLVQPLCKVEWEMRHVSVGRLVVTSSPIAWHLTPATRGICGDWLFETPRSRESSIQSNHSEAMRALAEKVADSCSYDDVIIDTAIIDGIPGVVEFNPFSIGNFGLYACDPAKIAEAYADKFEASRAKGAPLHEKEISECPIRIKGSS